MTGTERPSSYRYNIYDFARLNVIHHPNTFAAASLCLWVVSFRVAWWHTIYIMFALFVFFLSVCSTVKVRYMIKWPRLYYAVHIVSHVAADGLTQHHRAQNTSVVNRPAYSVIVYFFLLWRRNLCEPPYIKHGMNRKTSDRSCTEIWIPHIWFNYIQISHPRKLRVSIAVCTNMQAIGLKWRWLFDTFSLIRNMSLMD